MSDLELLFLVLAAVYGWESACWLRRGSVGFRTWLGKHWRILHPGTLLGNPHGGFVFAAPLPPLGSFLSGNQFPLSLSPDGILAFVSSSVNPGWRPPQTGACIRFDQIQTIEARGKTVLVNGKLLVKSASPSFARYLAGHLSSMRQAPLAEREVLIRRIFRERFDTASIKDRWEEFQRFVRPIRWLTNVLFVYLFVLIPAIIWNFGLMRSWPGLLAGLLVLTGSIGLYFRRIHKALYPIADDERFTHCLTVLLSPVTAIRAHDLLSRPLLETSHPLAIAAQFCSRDKLESFAERMLRELRFPGLPVCPDADPAAASVESWSRAELRRTVEGFLKKHKIDPDPLVRAPIPTDVTCRAYCPRCHAQFTTESGVCEDCGGLTLMPFARQRSVADPLTTRENRQRGGME